MRIEKHFNRSIVCGHIFPIDEIKPGSEWQGGSGSTVRVDSVEGEWLTYSWVEHGERRSHTKLAFAFQCRYCLIATS